MDLGNHRIGVTGATGFLGSHIAMECLARGAKVRGIVRSPEKGAWLEEKGVELAKADLMDRDALTRAFEGLDAVISNAALFTVSRKSWDDFYRPNKIGTENVYHALHQAGVTRVVQVSTVGVYKPHLWGVVNEDAPRLRMRDRYINWNYAVTKALSEDIAWQMSHTHGLKLTVVRPGPIYGPRDRNMVPVFKRLMSFPVMLAPTFGLPAVHVADVANAIVGAVANDASIGRAYNATGVPISIRTFMKTWKTICGDGPPLIPLWIPLSMRFDTTAAQRDLGFRSRPIDEGLKDTLGQQPPP